MRIQRKLIRMGLTSHRVHFLVFESNPFVNQILRKHLAFEKKLLVRF